jgi:hypothetical protein
VRERLIRDLIVFICMMVADRQDYVEQILDTATFLEYGADEQELVDRVVTNFHPSVLAHSAFMDKPHTRAELLKIIEALEERASVRVERKQQEVKKVVRGEPKPVHQGESTTQQRRGPKCWGCGQLGHVRRDCRKNPEPRNEQVSGGQGTPRGRILGALKHVRRSAEMPLWFMAEFQVGRLPTVVDTGAQFCCIRADMVEHFGGKVFPVNLRHVT